MLRYWYQAKKTSLHIERVELTPDVEVLLYIAAAFISLSLLLRFLFFHNSKKPSAKQKNKLQHLSAIEFAQFLLTIITYHPPKKLLMIL